MYGHKNLYITAKVIFTVNDIPVVIALKPVSAQGEYTIPRCFFPPTHTDFAIYMYIFSFQSQKST